MSDREKIIAAFSSVHASPSLIMEVLNMKENRQVFSSRKLIAVALAVCLILALGATAYGAGKSIFGWANNSEIRVTENESGVVSETMLYTENLTEPVIIKDGRMIFIVNNENIDITDKVSETEAFFYEYEDIDGVTHCIIIGLNSTELENFGYGEFMKENNVWIGGYSARTNLEADGSGPAWLENGKDQLNIPW